ncbi:MAG: DUF815 domain-containing protein, partial [Sulfurovaceae bacterium]
MKNINWKNTFGAIWRAKSGHFRAVKVLRLRNVENDQESDFACKGLFVAIGHTPNTDLFRGAVLNHFSSKGLRVIEIDRDDLDDLLEISDIIRNEPYRFIIFCDDLSFEEGEKGYKGLKKIMEGSIEAPPNNVIIYATSNRRHLVPEYVSDNEGTKVGNRGEIHYGDNVEEKISLSDRFGLWLSFYTGNEEEYLKVVDSYFEDYKGDQEVLHQKALDFARSRASKSGRT